MIFDEISPFPSFLLKYHKPSFSLKLIENPNRENNGKTLAYVDSTFQKIKLNIGRARCCLFLKNYYETENISRMVVKPILKSHNITAKDIINGFKDDDLGEILYFYSGAEYELKK